MRILKSILITIAVCFVLISEYNSIIQLAYGTEYECVPVPVYRERACPECLGTLFRIRVDEINPALVVGFDCAYCGHFLPVGRVEG